MLRRVKLTELSRKECLSSLTKKAPRGSSKIKQTHSATAHKILLLEHRKRLNRIAWVAIGRSYDSLLEEAYIKWPELKPLGVDVDVARCSRGARGSLRGSESRLGGVAGQ